MQQTASTKTWTRNLALCLMGLVILLAFMGAYTVAYGAENNDANSELEPVNLQLKWHHQFQFAGYYAALEQGYYREAGLNVTLHQGSIETDVIEEVLSQKAHFGVWGSDLVLHKAEGKPVVALAAIFQHSPIGVISLKSSRILTPHDLIGRKLMWHRLIEDNIPAMLMHEGIDLSQINILDMTFKGDELTSGSTDAIATYLTNMPFFLHKKGIEFNTIRPEEYGAHYYGDTLFTSETMTKNKPETVSRFREASIRGWEYAMANVDEMIDLIKTKYQSSRSRDHLEYEAKIMQGLILPHLVQIGHMNPARWERIAQNGVDLENIAPGYDLEGFVYTPPSGTFDFDKATAIRWATIMFAIIFVALFLLVWGFAVRLRKEVVRQTTEIRQSMKKAEAASHAKNNFLANMSHEIRTPMNGVLGMLQLLQLSKLNQDQKTYVDNAILASKRLTRLLSDILDLSRIEAGKLDIVAHPFDLAETLHSVKQLFKEPANQKGLRYEVIPPKSVPTLLGDNVRLQQVLNNLVGNAVKFTLTGEIRLEAALLASTNDKAQILFTVSDTGPSFPDIMIEQLLQPFAQSEDSYTRQHQGAGLGLAIVKELTHRMGGDITISNNLGIGTTFYLSIPFSIADSSTLHP